MEITGNTNLTQHAVMFFDGDNGTFNQEYSIRADGAELNITMCVSGGRDIETTRKFYVDSDVFSEFNDAVEAAEHTIKK